MLAPRGRGAVGLRSSIPRLVDRPPGRIVRADRRDPVRRRAGHVAGRADVGGRAQTGPHPRGEGHRSARPVLPDTVQNRIWVAITALAADPLAWCARLALPATAAGHEPERPRLRILATAGRLVRSARRRILNINPTWPWAEAITAAHARLRASPSSDRRPGPDDQDLDDQDPEDWQTTLSRRLRTPTNQTGSRPISETIEHHSTAVTKDRGLCPVTRVVPFRVYGAGVEGART